MPTRPRDEPPSAAAPADPSPELRLLGAAAWRTGSGSPWQPLVEKDALLLAALALEGPQARVTLAARLWPGVPAPRAQANLRQRLFRLRRQQALLLSEDGERLALAPGVACDLLEGDGHPPGGLAAPLLDGCTAAFDEAATRWLEGARLAWAARRPERWLAAAARREAAGDLAAALALVQQLLAEEPLLEHAWRRLMQLHLARGDRAAALAAFERCEQVLRRELGVRPSPPTLALLQRAESLVPQGQPPDAAWPAALCRPMPFTGREAERRAMAAIWADGRAFVLVGEAGMGKSRLLGVWAAAQPGSVLSAARPGDEPVACATLVRLLRAVAHAATRPDALWPDGAARRELARLLPELGEPPASDGLQALLHDAVERTLERAPAAGVTAVLLDDLQQADDATLALLPRLLGIPGLAWGLATRPGHRPDLAAWLAASSRLAAVPLAPLDTAALATMLGAMALPDGLAAAVQAGGLERLARHSGGNPLFVLETLRHLAQTGAPGGLPADQPLPLPPSVQALLAQRLAALPPQARALAQVAAVAAEDFDAALAARVLGCPLLDLAEPWQALERAQVLVGQRFVHDALRDAVLATLPQPLRASLHAGLGRCLAEQGVAPARTARHLSAGGCWAEAGAAHLQAADAARRLGLPRAWRAALDAAAEAFERLGDEDAAFSARLAAVAPQHAAEGVQAAQQALDALAPAAQADPAREGRWRLESAELALAAYDQPLLAAQAQAALDLAPPGSDAQRLALGLVACAAARAGEAERAEQHLDALRPVLAGAAPGPPLLSSWNHVAVVLHHLGRARELAAALEQQRALAHAIGRPDREADALLSLAALQVQLGDAPRAVGDGRRAVSLQRRLGAEHLARMGELNLLIALVGVSALDEALPLSEALAQHFATAAADSDLPHIVADLRADIWMRLGQPARALDELAAAPLDKLVAVRQVHRLGLRWRAAAALGDGAAAATAMLQLQQRLKPPADSPARPVRSGGVWVRCAVLLALHLGPGAAAAGWLAQAEAAAQAADLPAGQALAALASLQLALRVDDAAAALVQARRLQALRAQARHLYVDEAELLAGVAQALRAAGLHAEAAGWRLQARQWAQAALLARLPPVLAAGWRQRPELAALWVDAG